LMWWTNCFLHRSHRKLYCNEVCWPWVDIIVKAILFLVWL
jgi:hypothetical protein